MYFPNYAGVDDIDDDLAAELNLAGITVNVFRGLQSGEVKTDILGSVHGWSFDRRWRYWSAKGPGIPCDVATELWDRDKTVRVDGHAASPSPIEWLNGFGIGLYHIDTQEGLKELADVIKSVYREE